ncbi:MAG: nucleotide exchange factor GrpE [Methylobacter sp.]|nr:nucleotide exchange factor GrpE [Methylobacter sp.]MDP2428198.1 nucleotide exchange factor GrpE [Methylobacter sp.]MDP3055218.1 nucleotide exchange factor GrpE [Methylobacter sp.]MDP3361653.1 nucleotide exchange factor GrpE [Methylobacter sp.]MDZ4219582.1 nucleotide exchange factor GrpE [Methylobacter sp.]
MSNDQEAPDSQVKTESETAAETHTELSGHELTTEELQQALFEAAQKAQENWDKAVRVQAEMENLKRRTQKDLEDAHKFALSSFAKELLPVLDSLVLGLQAATGDSEDVKKFREGSELTIKQFESVFAKFKIETIDPLGQPFNAELHQAMAMQAVEGAAPNTVVNVFQKGYVLNGRLLRPAMVLVAKAAENKPTDNPSINEQA